MQHSSTNVHRVETITIVQRDIPSGRSLVEVRLSGPDGEHIINAFGSDRPPEVVNNAPTRVTLPADFGEPKTYDADMRGAGRGHLLSGDR